MNKCKICERSIPDEATHCSLKCLGEARIKGMNAVFKARASFSESMAKMLKEEPKKVSKAPMIIVKHRWKKNRLEVSGSTVIAFNEAGIASIPDVGNARLDAETFVRFSRNLAEIVTVEEPQIADAAAPIFIVAKEEPAAAEVVEAEASSSSISPEDVEDTEEEFQIAEDESQSAELEASVELEKANDHFADTHKVSTAKKIKTDIFSSKKKPVHKNKKD